MNNHRKRGEPKPKKSERIDIVKLRNHLDTLDLTKNNDLNFWLYCRIAMLTGLRSVDILNMKVKSINFTDRVAHIVEQKTKRKVTVNIYSDVLSRINKEQEFVLWNEKYSTPVSLMTINRRLKKIFKDDNINVSSHSIRKAVGRYIYEKTGNDVIKAMQFLGHKSPDTTRRYLEVNQDELNELYQLLEY